MNKKELSNLCIFYVINREKNAEYHNDWWYRHNERIYHSFDKQELIDYRNHYHVLNLSYESKNRFRFADVYDERIDIKRKPLFSPDSKFVGFACIDDEYFDFFLTDHELEYPNK